MSHRQPEGPVTREVFEDPIVQLAALCPFCALAALSPAAALAALSPALRLFNPAINPVASLLAFSMSNPQGAITAQINLRVHGRIAELSAKHRLKNHVRQWNS